MCMSKNMLVHFCLNINLSCIIKLRPLKYGIVFKGLNNVTMHLLENRGHVYISLANQPPDLTTWAKNVMLYYFKCLTVALREAHIEQLGQGGHVQTSLSLVNAHMYDWDRKNLSCAGIGTFSFPKQKSTICLSIRVENKHNSCTY